LSTENRTEQATPRRRQKASKRGQVARSRELSSAIALLAMTLLLSWRAPAWAAEWRGLFRQFLDTARQGELTLATPLIGKAAWIGLGWMAPVLALIWLLAVMSLISQGGLVIATEALLPDWSRFDPARQLQQMFSVSGMSRLLKSLLPFSILLYLAATMVLRDWNQMAHATGMGARTTVAWILNRLFEFSWEAGLALVAWSGLDYAVQRLQLERGLRMSKQEIRDESKEMEGNPAVKGRIRRLQRDLRRRRMLQDVPTATLVVTNPNEYAVALHYLPETMAAPQMVAKGRNLLAQRIKEIARWNDVPILENPPLARALYKAVQVGQTIPADLYAAVAEMLAFIYRMQGRWREQAPPAQDNVRRSGSMKESTDGR
jgi:flagellar biosynthesis protein FlhB